MALAHRGIVMNKDNARDYLPLVQALAEGKVIQSRMFSCDPWKDCARPDFTMDPSNYRIKPEPREIWVRRHSNGSNSAYAYSSKKEAEYEISAGWSVIRYREVIE